MRSRYFGDLKIGARFKSDRFAVTEEAIIEFAAQFDPQGFHLDPTAAAGTIFGGLTASGWHTAAITMRLFVQTLNFGEGIIGLGVDELRWPVPVRPGDVLEVETKILKLRRSKSKPQFGIVKLHNTTRNQLNKVVQTMVASAFVSIRKR